ncbi:MAG: ABC transporter ATP-binding protein [Planctomycetota bacterium]
MAESVQRVVETRKLTKVFRDFWLREKVVAVRDLDLEIRPGEVFGMLGPNGSGKSTTLKMILGLMYPTGGRIGVFGKSPSDVGTKARIGFLPEDSYLYPFLDGRETLDFYGRLFRQGRSERARRIDMLLEMVGLSAAAYRRVGEYSKGMQRRIGLAQALINDPDLLILDEPTSGMDPIGTKQFKDLIRTLAARGKTVILSSHLLADVEDVCDRVCVLYGGTKRAEGDVHDLLAEDDSLQITTDPLDEATLNELQQVIAGHGGSVRSISPPRQKLEELFLRIVDEAQQQRMATGGATAGGEVAEFLRGQGDSGRAVIEQLIHTEAVEETTTEPVESAEPASAVDHEVLDELVGGGEDMTAEDDRSVSGTLPEGEGSDQSVRQDQPRKNVDRGVIEDLLGDDEENA